MNEEMEILNTPMPIYQILKTQPRNIFISAKAFRHIMNYADLDTLAKKMPKIALSFKEMMGHNFSQIGFDTVYYMLWDRITNADQGCLTESGNAKTYEKEKCPDNLLVVIEDSALELFDYGRKFEPHTDLITWKEFIDIYLK